MREQFFRKSIIRAGLSLLFGLIIAFCSCTYIALYIYADGYNLTFPIILLLIGLIMLGGGIYRIKKLGKIIDAEEVDFDEK